MCRMDTADSKLGVSRSLLTADWEWPIHGLRHMPAAGTSGWYCWTGEWSSEPDSSFHCTNGTCSNGCLSWLNILTCLPGPDF